MKTSGEKLGFYITVLSGIHEKSLGLQVFYVVDGLLGWLEAQGWLSTFANLGLKVVMNLIAKCYHFMNWQSLTYVQKLVGGCQFRVLTDNITDFVGVLNDRDVTYFENVISDVFLPLCLIKKVLNT